MNPQITQLRCWLVLSSLAASLQITLAYYDPGIQRWINRDPISDQGRRAFWPPEVLSTARLSPTGWGVPSLHFNVNRHGVAKVGGVNAYTFIANLRAERQKQIPINRL